MRSNGSSARKGGEGARPIPRQGSGTDDASPPRRPYEGRPTSRTVARRWLGHRSADVPSFWNRALRVRSASTFRRHMSRQRRKRPRDGASRIPRDRVVCCYPEFEGLLDESLRHADVYFAFSYPRDLWYVRAVGWTRKPGSTDHSEYVSIIRPSRVGHGASDSSIGLHTAQPQLYAHVVCRCVRAMTGGNDDAMFRDALERLHKGDFSRLESLFGPGPEDRAGASQVLRCRWCCAASPVGVWFRGASTRRQLRARVAGHARPTQRAAG